MLQYGEFSPNNPKMRVATQPYLGLGEYETRRQFLLEERKTEYQQYADKIKKIAEQDNTFIKNSLKQCRPTSKRQLSINHKAVQTDIQDINIKLIQCDISRDQNATIPGHRLKSPRNRGVTIDKVQIETQNNIIVPGYNKYFDKMAAKNTSPRAKLMADLQSSYFPTMLGYTSTPPAIDDSDRLEKVRRQEQYLAELRQQIEEKQNLLQKHKDQEKYQKDLEIQKLEIQLREAGINDKAILTKQPYSADVTTKLRGYETKSGVISTKRNERPYNSHNRETSLTPHSDTPHSNFASKFMKTQPVSRNDRPPYSFNIPSNSVFANLQSSKEVYDRKNSKLAINLKSKNTTNRIEKQIINVNRNPKLEDALPVPVLKAQSPIAKELINALPVQSKTSDAIRKLEDKWQVPVVQKNIIKTTERQIPGNNQGILTQLGAIRLQLQQEQLRLDETLRKRGISQHSNIDIHY